MMMMIMMMMMMVMMMMVMMMMMMMMMVMMMMMMIEFFVPLLASLRVSLNMPLSRVICVTHYTGFPFGSASFTELLCWHGTVLSALSQFTCRNSVALCRLWLGVKRFVPLLVANS